MQRRLSPTRSWSGFLPSLLHCWVPKEDGDRDEDGNGLSFLSCCQFLGAARGKAQPGPAQALSLSRCGWARGAATAPHCSPASPPGPILPEDIFNYRPLCPACVQGRLTSLAQRQAAAQAAAPACQLGHRPALLPRIRLRRHLLRVTPLLRLELSPAGFRSPWQP